MAKLERNTQKIFAAQAGSQQITAFGTAKSENPVYTTDLSQIQNNNYSYGWATAILPDKAPYEEDTNALFYAITRQLAYLFQEGLPEYDPNTEYSLNALVKGVGTNVIYSSLIANNLGNPIDNPDYWAVYNSGGGLASYEIGLPQPTLSNTLLPNEIWLDGSAVSRITYSKLFAIYGITYGAGNGSTTFNLPDCTNRVFLGANDFGYANAQYPSIQIPYNGWQAGSVAPGTIQAGTLIVGSGRKEISETLESLRGAANNANAIISGQFMPPAIKARFKTRYY